MGKSYCCRDPKKCGHYVKRRKYISAESELFIEYKGCDSYDLAEQVVHGLDAYRCPYEKGENQ